MLSSISESILVTYYMEQLEIEETIMKECLRMSSISYFSANASASIGDSN